MSEQMKLPFPTRPGAKDDPFAMRWPESSWWLDEGALDPAHVTRYLRNVAKLEEAGTGFGISEGEWVRIGRSEYELDPSKRKKLQEACYALYYKNPFARNIINNLSFYTLGKQGVQVDWKGDEIAEHRWAVLKKRNKWAAFSKEIAKLTFLCGEDYVVLFPLEGELKLDVREIFPTEIEEIQTEEEDLMQPTFYVRRLPQSLQTIRYDAKDVVHFKLHAVGPVKHGRSVLEPALEPIMMYDEWLHTRLDLSRMRSRLPIIRYLKGNVDAIPIKALPEPGTVISANKDREEYVFPSLNIEASDAKEEAREIKLYIATAVSLPEYMVTSDTAAAYNATAAVETTPLSMFKDLQGTFRDYFEELIWKLMPREAERVQPVISFPDVDLRNFNEKVRTIISEFTAGLRSRRTAQLELDLDPEEEAKWMKEELLPPESDERFRKLVEATVFHWPAIKEYGGNGHSAVEKLAEFLEKKGLLE